jgi:hypothetical protein
MCMGRVGCGVCCMSEIGLNATCYWLSDLARRMPFDLSVNAGHVATLLQVNLHAHIGKSIAIVSAPDADIN